MKNYWVWLLIEFEGKKPKQKNNHPKMFACLANIAEWSKVRSREKQTQKLYCHSEQKQTPDTISVFLLLIPPAITVELPWQMLRITYMIKYSSIEYINCHNCC